MKISKVGLPVAFGLLFSVSAHCQSQEETVRQETKPEAPAVERSQKQETKNTEVRQRSASASGEQRRTVVRQKNNTAGTVRPVQQRKQSQPRR